MLLLIFGLLLPRSDLLRGFRNTSTTAKEVVARQKWAAGGVMRVGPGKQEVGGCLSVSV